MTLHSICLDLDYSSPSTAYRRSNLLVLIPSTYRLESPVGGRKAKRSEQKKPPPLLFGAPD